ncbi:MAG: hypothetical protein WB729_08240 [Candidatus Sulfotelmatobacter sp.]
MVTRRGKEEPGTNGSSKGKIKFRYMDSERVVDFSVENMTGDSVTDGLHSIANALAGRTLQRKAQPDPKRIAAGGGTPAVDLEEEIETPELEDQEQEILEPEADDTGDGQTPKPKKTPKAPKAPKMLKEPKLTEAKVSLEDFMKQKNATEMMDKYAIVAVWYKEQFEVTDINIDRIFTAFTVLGQVSQLPTDVEKPLKNMTYSKTKKWFDKAEAAGTYTLNWLGESEVGKMGAIKG